MPNGIKTLTEEERIKLRESFIAIDNFIKEYLWQLDIKTPSRWVKVSNDIRDFVPLVSESGYALYNPSDEELKKAQRQEYVTDRDVIITDERRNRACTTLGSP